jgi:hypothetical protein
LSVTDVDLSWDEEERILGDLTDNSKNPRKISKAAFEKLVDLIKKNGYHQRITINRDNMIIGGHQRKKALLEAGWSKKSIIKVLVPCRYLTEEEIDSLTISDNGNFGEYDLDMLANEYDMGKLLDWGVPAFLYDVVNDISESKESKKREPKQQTCPECGHQFI